MLTVVTMLWNDPFQRWNTYYRYGIDHVKRMRSMVDRNLDMPHRFVLATDNLDHNIDNMDMVLLPEEMLRLRHRWVKLILFSPDAYDMFGERILYLDLDSVITGPLDQLIGDHDFRIIGRTTTVADMYYNSSMILLKTGARERVWTEFDPKCADDLCQDNGISASDQYWIGRCLGPNEATWGPQDGVHIFRKLRPHTPLPDGTKVVTFPGPVDPSMPQLQDAYPWIAQHWR